MQAHKNDFNNPQLRSKELTIDVCKESIQFHHNGCPNSQGCTVGDEKSMNHTLNNPEPNKEELLKSIKNTSSECLLKAIKYACETFFIL